MKKLGGVLIVTVFLLTGCSNSNYIEDDRISETTGSEEMNTNLENTSSENENVEKWYSNDNIINYNESIYAFRIPDNFSREVVMGEYNELFPSGLQDALLYLNDDIPDEDKDNAWIEYKAECEYEKVTLEVEGFDYYEDINALKADIDTDGEEEYIFSVAEGGTANKVRTIVAKSMDDEWLAIGGLTSDNSSVRALLEWENQYYLLMGDHLAFWNNEAEVPDWKNSLIPGQEECWNTLSIEKDITGYTPMMVYGDLENEVMDYLENMDFVNPYSNATEDIAYSSWSCWYGKNNSFQAKYAWTEMRRGEEYQYIVLEITGGTDYQDDLLLTVCRYTTTGRMEVVALYYLIADYAMEFY